MDRPTLSSTVWWLTPLGLAAVMLSIAQPAAVVYVLASLVLFAAPGVLLMSLLARAASLAISLDAVLIVGSIAGLAISSSTATALAVISGSLTPIPALGLIGLALALAPGAARACANRGALPKTPSVQRLLLLFFVVASSLALVIPSRSFGRPTPPGLAFSWLHKTDLLHHMTTFIALTQGIPPLNPYFAGEVLHYYWLPHVFPAFAYSLAGGGVQARDIMVLTAMLYAILFVCALWLLVHTLYPSPTVSFCLLTVSVLASGYNYLLLLVRQLVSALPAGPLLSPLSRYLLVDEWGQEYTGYSHGWFRSFLVEPHTTLALSLLLCALYLSLRYGFFPERAAPRFAQAALIALTLPVDAFIGAVAVSTWVLLGALRLRSAPQRRLAAKSMALSVGMSAAMAISMLALGMARLGHRSLVFAPYVKMLALFPLYFVMDFGPTVLLGGIGLLVLARERDKSTDSVRLFFLLLAAVSLAFMFLIRYPEVGTQVFRKGAITLRLSLVVLAGLALQHLLAGDRRRARAHAILASLLVLALPSFVSDIYLIAQHDESPGTFYVRSQDLAAYAWVKANLPPDAIVQDLPSGISAIPAFAERPTALGDWVHAENYQIGTARVAQRHRDIYRRLFMGTDVQEAVAVLREYGIQYAYIGTEARRKLSRQALQKYDEAPASLQRVYSREGVAIYRVRDVQTAER